MSQIIICDTVAEQGIRIYCIFQLAEQIAMERYDWLMSVRYRSINMRVPYFSIFSSNPNTNSNGSFNDV